MNTSKWGPPGWVLDHKIASLYPINPNLEDKKKYYIFYICVRKIYPCKYCRESYTNFLNQIDINDHLDNNRDFQYFRYKIHNLVNNKLRNQGYLNTNDPTFEEVVNKYKNMTNLYVFEKSWDFIYSIIFNYKPEMYNYYKEFFDNFIVLIPGEQYKKLWENYWLDTEVKKKFEEASNDCQKLIKWLYLLQSSMYKDLGMSMQTFEDIYAKYDSWRAKCAKNTCRLPVK